MFCSFLFCVYIVSIVQGNSYIEYIKAESVTADRPQDTILIFLKGKTRKETDEQDRENKIESPLQKNTPLLYDVTN